MARAKANFGSVARAGTATAPAAAAAIATALDADLKGQGWYDVEVYGAYLAGTPAAAEDNNLELRVGTVVIGGILMPRAANVISGPHRFTVYKTKGLDISVNATGAGTAAVVYSASLIASRVV